MNEQNSKKILFNKSTLWSLKAELLKKQEEVQEKKQLPQHKMENYKPHPAKKENNEETTTNNKKSFKDSLKEIDTEELEACRKSKAVLEKKAELYEHLTDSAGTSQLADRFLVDFNTKKHQEAPNREPSPVLEHVDSNQVDLEDDNEWTEFTDCLGRTRKCLKSDLELYEKRDKALMRTMNMDKPDEGKDVASESDVPKPEKPILVQKTNDYLQSLREKWENRENELLAKDKDIHYQDLLFDEARMHGVAYYSFSTDESERRKQMEELVKRREDTVRLQREAQEARAKRDELMAARVAAARARTRARAGLPPEEPRENEKDFTKCLLEFLTKQKDEADAKANEEEKKIREEQEKERQKLRESYLREWDIGKEGVESKVKKFKEMTQEEYVDQQRAKRIDEFAPQQASSSNRSDYMFDGKGRKIQADPEYPAPTKSWDDVRPKLKTPPPPNLGAIIEQKGLYFSTNKKIELNLKYRNFVRAQERLPNEGYARTAEKRKFDFNVSNHSDISLTPTYDYTGAIPKRSRREKPLDSNILEAHAQGAHEKSKINFAMCQEPLPIINELDEDEGDTQSTEKSKLDFNVSNHTEISLTPTYDYNGAIPKRSRSEKPLESNILEAHAPGANKKPKVNLKYRNFVICQEPLPIINELDEDEGDTQSTEKSKFDFNVSNHTEIAPPPTYDYYGPVPKHSKPDKFFESDIREAYAQGAKSLESKARNLQLPQHYDFTFD